MNHVHARLATAVSFLAIASAPSLANSQPSDRVLNAGHPIDCPYEFCGLRVEGKSVLRGFAGDPVGRLGPLGGELDFLLESDPEVAVYAERYQNSTRKGSLARLVALPLIGLGTVAVENGPSDYGGTAVATFGAAWTLGLYILNRALVETRSGRHAIHHSIWAYNRSFAPEGMAPPPLYPIEPRRDPSAWLILGGGSLGALAGTLGNGQVGFYWGTLTGAGIGALLSMVGVDW